MKEEDAEQLADLVADRVFAAMSKFVDALEGVVRENEALQTKVAHLELLVFGVADDDDDQDADDAEYEDVPQDELNDFFDWLDESDDDDDVPPTFD